LSAADDRVLLTIDMIVALVVAVNDVAEWNQPS
jgi:hypothetical protein